MRTWISGWVAYSYSAECWYSFTVCTCCKPEGMNTCTNFKVVQSFSDYIILKLLLTLNALKMCLRFWLYVHMWMWVQMPEESTRGRLTPWSSSYRWFWATLHGSWEPKLWSSVRAFHVLGHWASPSTVMRHGKCEIGSGFQAREGTA